MQITRQQFLRVTSCERDNTRCRYIWYSTGFFYSFLLTVLVSNNYINTHVFWVKLVMFLCWSRLSVDAIGMPSSKRCGWKCLFDIIELFFYRDVFSVPRQSGHCSPFTVCLASLLEPHWNRVSSVKWLLDGHKASWLCWFSYRSSAGEGSWRSMAWDNSKLCWPCWEMKRVTLCILSASWVLALKKGFNFVVPVT